MQQIFFKSLPSWIGACVLVCCLCATPATAQRQCGTTEGDSILLAQHPEYKIARKQLEQKIRQQLETEEIIDGIIIIPVVFHILHNGDAVGSGENIDDALIHAQIDQMNLDFRRLNTDAGNAPAVFAGVAADIRIEFCLARTDPAGNPTTGILRRNISTLGTSVSEADCWTQGYINSRMKTPTIWDRDRYLNIWATNKIERIEDSNCNSGILGYAQFPGMAANTDGVVLLASTVGSMATPSPNGGAYNLGRTGTHEVGHWLGLRHIWGDADCGDDGIADTPTHFGPNGGCPTFPSVTCSNGPNGDMFVNYMDYTDDNCMNMFTAGQRDVMLLTVAAIRPGLIASECGACPLTLSLNSTAPGDLNGIADYSAIQTIEATNQILAGAQVTYRAGEAIRLLPSFHARSGTSFRAYIDDCSTAPRPAVVLREHSDAANATGDVADLHVWPNPFDGDCTIRLTLPTAATVSLTLLDLQGRIIQNWQENESLAAGVHTFTLANAKLPAGMYLLEMRSEQGRLLKKIVRQGL